MAEPDGALEVVGVRFVPSPSAMAWLRRARRVLARAHRSSAIPPLAIQEGLAGLYDNRVLGLLVELGVPDLIDAPRTASSLAEEVGVDAEGLDRVLRFASTRGFVKAHRFGRYGATPVSRFLRTDHPSGWDEVVRRATSGNFWAAWRDLDLRLGVERPPHRDPIKDVDAAGTTIQAFALSHDLRWDRDELVCDVGGGSGAALEVLLQRHPNLQGVLLELPEMVAHARPELVSGSLRDRCTIASGDFTDSVPAEADCYLLMAIMTECDDDRARAVLSTVRAAMAPGARLLVVDSPISERPTDEYAQLTDLLLLTFDVGRERTRKEYRRLFARSGLRLRAEHQLFTGSTAFELVAGP